MSSRSGGGHRAAGPPPARTAGNYAFKQLSFEEESPYVHESELVGEDYAGAGGREPISGIGSSSRDSTSMDRKRSRLSFYLNRRSTAAMAYWEKRQQRERQDALEATQYLTEADPTPQAYRSAAQQALVAAMDVNKETLSTITHIERVMYETEAIGHESTVNIRAGDEALEVVDSSLQQLDPLMKRAKKDLIWFFRTMMRDKMFMCLTFVVVGMAVAVLITSKVKGKPSLPISISIPQNFTCC